MPAADGWRHALDRQASEKAQGRKPPAGMAGRTPPFYSAGVTSLTAPLQPLWVRSNTMPSGSVHLTSK